MTMIPLGKWRSVKRSTPCFEVLERRFALATASGVENVLLPEFMAQMADPNGNQLPASDAWWALRSQRNMAIDEPISKVMNFAAHIPAQASHTTVMLHTYLDDHPQSGTPADTLSITVTVTDAGGLFDQEQTEVRILNSPPSIGQFINSALNPGDVDEGELVRIHASFADNGVLDTHTVQVDWGDGSLTEMIPLNQFAGSGIISASHAYSVGGIFTITLTVADDDTGVEVATSRAFVTGVGLHNEVLYVIGSSQRDNVNLNVSGQRNVKVHASFIERHREFALADISQIVAYLGDGEDQMTVSTHVNIPTVIHGGRGDDRLDGGGGPTVLLGEQGDDRLDAGSGPAILIGGIGMDRLGADRAGGILIGGSTSIDVDDQALLTRLLNWSSATSFAIRVANFTNSVVVLDDSQEDQLTGGKERDLLFAGLGDMLRKATKDDKVWP